MDTLRRHTGLPSLVTARRERGLEPTSGGSHSRHPARQMYRTANASLLRARSVGGDSLRHTTHTQPPVAAFLESICNMGLVHMVIKLDGQPARFPAVVSLGGDVDFLTSTEHFRSLQAAVTRFFGDWLGMLGTDVTSRAVSRKPSHWQFRMEQQGRLIYQVHLIQAADAEAAAMLGRRVRLVERSRCLWAPAPADAVRLRERDCVEKRRAGRASNLCPTEPRPHQGR